MQPFLVKLKICIQARTKKTCNTVRQEIHIFQKFIREFSEIILGPEKLDNIQKWHQIDIII